MAKVYFNHTTKLTVTKMGLVPAATISLMKIDGRIYYGIAICSKYDNFKKSYGRETAEERMNSGFGVLDIPKPLEAASEREQCLQMLYALTASVVTKPKKWKKRVTKYNLGHRLPAETVPMLNHNSTPEDSDIETDNKN